MRTSQLFALLSLCTLQACGVGVFGNGKVATETRQVGAFKRISINSAVKATLTPGTRALTLRADDNLLPLLETVVEGDTLVIRTKAGEFIGHATALEATITNDVLEGVEASGAATVTGAATPATSFPISASGSSDVVLTGLSSTSLTINASGSSTVTVSGAAMTGAVTASGASDVHLRGVPLQSLQVDASGSSNVDAQVSGSLTGAASGASDIVIVGNPTDSVAVSGSSTVRLNAP
jgi:Putative auto-transporter adhesin, head GIN domain